MASVQGSTGVDQDRGMCEEKRKDGPILQSRHLELGRPGKGGGFFSVKMLEKSSAG